MSESEQSPAYYGKAEEIVDILVRKTQTEARHFFRLIVAYYMAKLASMMRTNIEIPDRGTIPVNLYVVNLGNSGLGKTYSMNIMEEDIIQKFKYKFMEEIFPMAAETNLSKLACVKSAKHGMSPEDALTILKHEFDTLGTIAFSFDSGTSPAVKQMRHKLLMAGAGSINFEMDELGSNLSANTDVLEVFLELFDIGKTKAKLIKNTKDNVRNEEIDGRTPTNCLMFGTPSRLFDGNRTEDLFFSLLDTGYARRLMFGYTKDIVKQSHLSAEEQYNRGVASNTDQLVAELSDELEALADKKYFGHTLQIPKPVAIKLIQYRIDCEVKAMEMRDHDDISKAEMAHRYYKAIKLAGAYAFWDRSNRIEMPHLEAAIQLTEDSGVNFTEIMNRERNYVRLAKYLADINQEITAVDLIEDLPWFPKSETGRREILNLATAYGYKNNIIIKTSVDSGVEFYTGESLKETDLNNIHISYSTDVAFGYKAETGKFSDLYKVITSPGYHYTSHAFEGGHRTAEKALLGFDLLILDMDDGITIDTAKFLLDEYTFLIATTKRHTDQQHRFRIILPMSHYLRLTPLEYKAFMENVFKWLPFGTDAQTKDIARKWQCHKGEHYYHEGKLVDATLFIPKTSKAAEHNNFVADNSSLNNLERWFLHNTAEGNRSNNLIRFGYILVDAGFSYDQIETKIKNLNDKMPRPLPAMELESTILKSLQTKVNQHE